MNNILDICEISGTPVKKFEGKRKYIATGDINGNMITSFVEVDYASKPSRANQNVEIGDVLFAKMKETVKVLVIDETNCNNIYSTGFFVMKPKKDVSSQYLYWLFNSQQFNNDKDKNSKGATQKAINREGLKKIKLSKIIELEEQNHISNILNNIQEIIDLRKKQLDNLDKLIKAKFIDIFGKYNNIEENMVKLNDIAEFWNGLTYKPEDISDKGTIVLRSNNIKNNRLDFSNLVRVNCKINEKKIIKNNDILMCSRNGSSRLVGKVALMDENKFQMAFGAFMMIIRSKYFSYLFTYFQTSHFRNQIISGATTTINQITTGMMNNIKIPLPKMEDVNKYEEFIIFINKQIEIISESLNQSKRLEESLMNRYFN